jgi:hypothetical protein
LRCGRAGGNDRNRQLLIQREPSWAIPKCAQHRTIDNLPATEEIFVAIPQTVDLKGSGLPDTLRH